MDDRDDSGIALIAVMNLVVVIGLLGLMLASVAVTRASQAASAARSTQSFGGAEASLDRYRAKLIDDPFYHFHFVDPFERSRVCTATGAVVDPNPTVAVPWPNDCAEWTYQDPPTPWTEVDGIRERIEVEPLTGGGVALTSVAAERNGVPRAIQATYRRSSIADFMLLAREIVTTDGTHSVYTGKFYGAKNCILAGKGTVAHDDYWCEGKITFKDKAKGPWKAPRPDTISFATPAWCYEKGGKGTVGSNKCGDIRSVLPEPINFSGFWNDLEALRFAACDNGGLCLAPGAKIMRVDGTLVDFPALGDDGWVRLVLKGPGDGSAAQPMLEVWTTPAWNYGPFDPSTTFDGTTGYTSALDYVFRLGTWEDPAAPLGSKSQPWVKLADVAYPTNGAIYSAHHVAVGWCDKATRTGPCQRTGGTLEESFGLYAGLGTQTGARHIVFRDEVRRPAGGIATAAFMSSGGVEVHLAAYPQIGGEFRLDAAVVVQGAHRSDERDSMLLMSPCYNNKEGVHWRFLGMHSGSADIRVAAGLACNPKGFEFEQGYDPTLREFPPPWIPSIDGEGWGLERWSETAVPDWGRP